MQTWKLLIEYEGTRYSGWQRQPNARTVQGELYKAATKIFPDKFEIGGSGRTDAGVHALEQIAHLKTGTFDKSLSPQKLQRALNDSLPHDINVSRVQNAPPQFHARHDAVQRFYLYQIATRRTAFGKNYVWWVKDRLDAAQMSQAAQLLIGKHDFRSFSEPDEAQTSSLVKIESAEIRETGNLILFRIGASHFLWKMVRRIVGSLVEVGRGNLTVNDFQRFFKSYSNQPAAWTAPPSGLFLEKILYRNESFSAKLEPAFPIRDFR